MKRYLSAALVAALVCGLGIPGWAQEDKVVQEILARGIQALGGEEKLSTVKAASWKSKGTFSFGGNESRFTMQIIVEGLDRFRNELEGEFMGNKVLGVTVLNGDRGWRKFGDMSMEMDKEAVANQKRAVYLQVIPAVLLPLKGPGFKAQPAGEETVAGKPAVGLKITGPDGKEFTLYFDKESGLPVKQVARVTGFMGEEFTQETTFSDYRDFDGIKKATKIENKRDGQRFMVGETTEFKLLPSVEPGTFAEPK